MDNLNSKINKNTSQYFNLDIENPIWLSVSEAAKLGGVNNKTIRRAIQAKNIKYKVVKNRYLINLESLVEYLYSTTKLKNKLYQYGIGQYIKTKQ